MTENAKEIINHFTTIFSNKMHFILIEAFFGGGLEFDWLSTKNDGFFAITQTRKRKRHLFLVRPETSDVGTSVSS